VLAFRRELLEETLLHSFDTLEGGGMASPHDRKTLDHIAQLRKDHGLDYGTHDSYRFVEKVA
jgi:hypothetical protein